MLRHRRRVLAGDLPARPDETPARSLEALVVASGRGDAAAFMSLYDRVAPRIYGFVLRILRDDRRAQDVTVQVFAELWRMSIGFDPQRGSARAWMTETAASRVRTELTRRGGDRSSVAWEPA